MSRPLLLALILATLAGCGNLVRLSGDLKDYEKTVADFSGTIRSPGCPDCATVIVVMGRKGKPVSYKVLEHPGYFKILSSPEAEGIFAFHDTNDNFEFDPDEPFAWQELTEERKKGTPATGLTLDIQQRSGYSHTGLSPRISLFDLRNKLGDGISIQLGRLAELDDRQFNPEFADLGMWQPMKFMRTGFAGIYFLEPYSPDKTPVLFIHGVNGTPRDFSTMIEHLDRSKYQFWFFYYPSGLEIPSIGNGLLGMMNKLWLELKFRKMHVVAHSMGGLVGRSFLNACREAHECDFIHTFTSIASPFGGAQQAKSGVEYSPVVMPVWRSMSPDSAFLRELFAKPLTGGVRHHLVFGFRNTSRLSKDSGDGTVPLDSQLPYAVQGQAASLRGFNEDHLSILTSAQVGSYLSLILSGNAETHHNFR